jgi:hypothetical protein
MPNTIVGLIIFVAFVVPGFVIIIEVRKKNPLFVQFRNQIEFLMWGWLLSIIVHLFLLMLTAIIVLLLFLIHDRSGYLLLLRLLSDPFMKGINLWDFQNAEIWQIRFFIYFVLSFFTAKLLGPRLAELFLGETLQEYRSVWVEAFRPGRVNFARAILDNAYTIIGIVEAIQSDARCRFGTARYSFARSSDISARRLKGTQ